MDDLIDELVYCNFFTDFLFQSQRFLQRDAINAPRWKFIDFFFQIKSKYSLDEFAVF